MLMRNKVLTVLALTCAQSLLFGVHAEVQGAERPAYTIANNDSLCHIFVYSAAPNDGLRLAYRTESKQWHSVGQLCTSDYGQWGKEKRMFAPYVVKAVDGTWRAAWSVNDKSPCFAVAYSEDLITWRPQDYPIVREKGVLAPAIRQNDDGSFSIYLKTREGCWCVQASENFRTFEESEVEAEVDMALWQRDTATIGGKCVEGNAFDITASHLKRITDWFSQMEELNAKINEQLPKTDADLKALTGKDFPAIIEASLTYDEGQSKAISNRLMGIFFEDISRAADGGLYAEMVQNGDFEYDGDNHRQKWTAETAWTGASVATEQPLSENNKHYSVLTTDTLANIGWDGFSLQPGAKYDFSLFARVPKGGKKKVKVLLLTPDGSAIASATIKFSGASWQKYTAVLETSNEASEASLRAKGIRLVLVPAGSSSASVDMVSLFPQDTYKGHGLRRDLAETIADLQPKFVRFPGGCMLHGDGLDNIYNWKESIGPLQDRKPARNIWNYHQTRGLGFYEYFQWCEDMGCEPLPVLAAGVPCQNSATNADGLGGQQGGIPMEDMPAYVQDVLDLIEWANGDPATSSWAKMRADAGHPSPFNLKMIGVGNEDLISTVFTERYLMIAKAIKEKYPDIEVIGTVGPFHWPSSDYIEGWKIANDNSGLFSMVDEHYYEQPGWFINNRDYYDSYDRSASKVYLGEYASRGRDALDNALAEGIHMCQLERNGDVVEMASYAPLLSKNGYSNWSPDMIYFTNDTIQLTESYKMQQLFSVHSGDTYIPSTLDVAPELSKYVGVSIVKDSTTGKTWLKVVNALPKTLRLKVAEAVYEVPSRSAEVFAL